MPAPHPLRHRRYREDVEHRAFPNDEESYHLSEPVRKTLDDTQQTGVLRKA